MTDYDRRGYAGSRGGHNNRKRRYREDDDYDRRPQRRRYEEPLHIKLRKQLLSIAESPLKTIDEEISSLAKLLVDNYFDVDVRSQFLDLTSQLVIEQPLKIPFLAAILLVTNPRKPELTQEVIERAGRGINEFVQAGAWREVKLVLRFLGCLQGLLQDDGVFPILAELFDRAVDCQTASESDTIGLEFVKIILLTIPYVMASSAVGCHDKAIAVLGQTQIIAATPHALESLVDPYPGSADHILQEPQPVIRLLQMQLQEESEREWQLACIPRPWILASKKFNEDTASDEALAEPSKHILPAITIPAVVRQGSRVRLPELYSSVYADQEIETVPPTTDLASCILRDALVDTINILDFNRNVSARILIDVDCYFAPGTFVKRATQFDKLRNVEEGKSTWKPEDVAVDAVFSQLLQLPNPEHKLVYYHSVLTEACKIAPAAIAPSLGRAIRWLYQHVEVMDLELIHRFMDWFSHHLSNFGFTWKWTEWVDDVTLLPVHPKKAFITGAFEKEIRLSFADRIRKTLPEPYQPLISDAALQLDNEAPMFKYKSDTTPYAEQGRQLIKLLQTKAPEEEINSCLESIERLALEQGVQDPLIASTDAYVTSICRLGCKTLSHMLLQIERCKTVLLSIGPRSEAARRQIITSVMDFWAEKPGVAVNIIDKLLNYTIITPSSVVLWVLGPDRLGKGEVLCTAHIFELVSNTVTKVTNRVRQLASAHVTARRLSDTDHITALEETLGRERNGMIELFKNIVDALTGVAEGTVDAMAESKDQDGLGEERLRGWGKRWLLVFSRRMAVEETWVLETLNSEPEGGDQPTQDDSIVSSKAGNAVVQNGNVDHADEVR